MQKKARFMLVVMLLLTSFISCQRRDENVIRIGLNCELTGEMPAVGNSSANGAKLAVKMVNQNGGVKVAGQTYPIQLLIEDNAGRAEQAVAVAQKFLAEDNVDALIGPNASRYAIPVAEVAESSKVPMISPWASSPKATIDSRTGQPKKYVFRISFIDPFQGKVDAAFARTTLNARRVAILFDLGSDHNREIAEVFRSRFTELGGEIVAFETYTSGDKDFSAQLTKIKSTGPDLVFLPNYYTEVPLQIQQAKRIGLTVPFLGTDAWASEDLLKLCGKDCEGYYFTTHFARDNATPAATDFVKRYTEEYGFAPDDLAALTYDAFMMLVQAMGEAQSRDRESFRTALASLKEYKGVTGDMRYEGSGDPIKTIVVVQIKDGKFNWFANANP